MLARCTQALHNYRFIRIIKAALSGLDTGQCEAVSISRTYHTGFACLPSIMNACKISRFENTIIFITCVANSEEMISDRNLDLFLLYYRGLQLYANHYLTALRCLNYGSQLWDIRGPNRLQQHGVYDKFLVDVRNYNGFFYRAYVTDIVDSGVLITPDCRDRVQSWFVPFESTHEVCLESPMITDNKRPIEVLVALAAGYPEFWFPGRIMEMVHFEGSCTYREWSLAKVEITTNEGETVQLVINDGPYLACRRIREPKDSSMVTPETFRRMGCPWPDPSLRCPDPQGDFPEVLSCRSFAYWWLKRTKTMFLSATDDWVAVLNRGDPMETLGWDVQNAIVVKYNPYKYSPFGYLEWFRRALLSGTSGIVHEIMQDVIESVIFTEQKFLERNIIFEDVHYDLRLLVLSYLNVYDRAALQRVSQSWKRLLLSRWVHRDLIITYLPSKWTLTEDSVHYLPTRNSVPDIISILCHSITKETRTVYLVGRWFFIKQPYLNSFVVCLKFLSIKLDWIVLADIDYFTPQAFIPFQTIGKYMNQLSQQIPDFPAVCYHLAIKNSLFTLWLHYFIPFNLNPLNLNIPKSFDILVDWWSFCFGKGEDDILAASLIAMLERCCPDLDGSIVERIQGRLAQLPKDIQTSFREDSFDAALWFILVFVMERWRLNVPRNVNEVQQFLNQESNGSAKKLLLQTLTYWNLLQTYESLPYIR